MNKRVRAKAEFYIERCAETWVLRDSILCDVCSKALNKERIDGWIEFGTPPFFCEEHARELNLLW